jgi:6-carboxyhexanoate--CoA ligase
MWSVRMRASRRDKHISGAEGLFEAAEAARAARDYVLRALGHARGQPDSIVVTVERLRQAPKRIAALPVSTLSCGSRRRARALATDALRSSGVSDVAIKAAFSVMDDKKAMRGAALIDAETGDRLEPDKKRGVRASRMGIDGKALQDLRKKLRPMGIDTGTVREALVLASKVASSTGVVAEVCISDDPDYTTGYVASGRLGYVRIPNMKKAGDARGGRAIFIKSGADIGKVVYHLERRPVMVAGMK